MVPSIFLHLLLFGGIAAAAMLLERRVHGRVRSIISTEGELRFGRRLLLGPWPSLWGAIGLVLLSVVTLLLVGRPWGITSAFALWGAKLLRVAGIEVEHLSLIHI